MGAIKEHAETIDDRRYTTRTFPASEGLVLMPRVLSLVSNELGNLLFVTNEEQVQKLLRSHKTLVAAALEIATKAAENDGLMVIKQLLKYTRCLDCQVGDGKIEASAYERFDTHFAGDYIHLFKVAWWVGRVSFTNP